MFFFIAALTNVCKAQSVLVPGTAVSAPDSTLAAADTSVRVIDTVTVRSAIQRLEDSLGIRISTDALPSKVTATATDSAVLDMLHSDFSLYGEAKVEYEDIKLNAGKIIYNQSTNTITASPVFDSLGAVSKPNFSQGSETVTYDSMQYNFKSKRALVRNARSQYGEGFVFSKQVKRNPDQSIYGWQNVYTTCALDTPHFGIRARKIRIIPNRVIASASANIMIEQVPTPIYLPFGLFPITQRQRSGFQLPSYTVEQQRGLGLTNGGYYFHFNEYVDLLVLTNLYTKGSYSLSGVSTYANRYRYNGGLSVSYASNKTGEAYEPGATNTKDFVINWRHQTDPKARPGTNFNASVNVGTSSFYSNNSYNTAQILNNQFTSNISYAKNWVNKPYSLTVSARHSQNTQTRLVDVTLPELNFFVSGFNPFQNKRRIGSPRWYEKISASYNFNAVNSTSFYDSTFSFNTLAADDFRNGMKHTIPVSAAYTAFRFININFGTNYTEYWLTRRSYYVYDNRQEKIDTIASQGFFTARDFNATMQLSTRIYGIKRFRGGKLAGIRHVLTPNVGFNYTPDYAAKPFNYYYQTRLENGSQLQYLSPYDGSIVGVPGLGQYGDFASSINYGLNNNLQIKVRNSKDTVSGTKNITLIDQLSIGGTYNIAADSFKWSPLQMTFRTNIANIVNLTGNATFDPYATNYSNGRRTPQTLWEEGNGVVRFRNANLALSGGFRSKEKKKRGNDARDDEFNSLMQNGGYNNYVDFNIPWSINVSYSIALDNRYATFSKTDTLTVTQSLLFNGDLNITSRWKMTFNSGYDFVNKQLTLTSIDIYRDLHCWEMRLGTIPFGPRKSFNFTLNVKAAILQDLKLVRRRDYRDAAVGY